MKSSVFLNLYFAFWAAWRRRYLIVIPIMIMPFIMLALGAMTPKKYQSHTTMLIQETTKLNPYLADFAVSTQLKERMAALKALLHSRHMLSEVALELGEIKTRDSKLAEQVISRLSASLTVQLIGSDMIKLVLVANKPTHMEKTLSVVSDHFLAKLLAPERSSIRASEVFLATQLKAQHESLLAAETDLAMFKRKNSAHLPDQYNYDVLQLRDLEAKLRERSMALSGAQGQLKSLKTQLLKTNPMLASIEESIVQETARLALLSSRYTDRHSSIVSVKASLQRLERERDSILQAVGGLSTQDMESLWQLASNLSVNASETAVRPLLVSQMEAIEKAKSTEGQLIEETRQLTAEITQLTLKLERFAAVEQQMTELERDIQTKQSLYDDLLKRHEMAKVTEALGRFEEQDRVKIIDWPYTPYGPVNLPLYLYGVLGIVAGLFLGIALSLVSEISNTAIVRRDAVERLIGVPVLTRIPKLSGSLNCSSLQIEEDYL